jgi:hypothetical protein
VGLESYRPGSNRVYVKAHGWLCVHNDDYKGSQMCIVTVTGPNQDIAIKLIKRMKALFESPGVTFDPKETLP